jgi:tetratricopeptide (TPR) repeat protein
MSERRREYLRIEALETVRNASKQENGEAKRLMLEEAIGKYRGYLGFEENKDDDDAWAGLGGAYRRIGDMDQAIESYATAYRLSGENTYALVNLVSLIAARRRPGDEALLQQYAARAEDHLRDRIASGKDDHWTWYDLATLELIQGKTSESMSTFLYAVERTPKEARENFASVLSNLQFLANQNPGMLGLADAISLIGKFAQPPQ